MPRCCSASSSTRRSSTYTYLLADAATREAVLIDPVFELHARDAALVRELGLTLRYTLETHVHADHVTAAWLFRERMGSAIVVSADAGVEGADRLVREGDVVAFGGETLSVLATPGHTDGCISYVTGDRAAVFTGDCADDSRRRSHRLPAGRRARALPIGARQAVRAARRLHRLPGARLRGPPGEQHRRGARLQPAPRRRAQRGGLRRVHGQPRPAAPEADRRGAAGEPALRAAARRREAPARAPEWAPARRSFAGVLEIEAEWLGEHLRGRAVVDVREPSEWNGELGRIPGARHLPLGELRARLGELPRDRPVVAVCRAGGRSAEASQILEQAGFARAANLSGGMIRWHELGLPTEQGAREIDDDDAGQRAIDGDLLLVAAVEVRAPELAVPAGVVHAAAALVDRHADRLAHAAHQDLTVGPVRGRRARAGSRSARG